MQVRCPSIKFVILRLVTLVHLIAKIDKKKLHLLLYYLRLWMVLIEIRNALGFLSLIKVFY